MADDVYETHDATSNKARDTGFSRFIAVSSHPSTIPTTAEEVQWMSRLLRPRIENISVDSSAHLNAPQSLFGYHGPEHRPETRNGRPIGTNFTLILKQTSRRVSKGLYTL